MYLITYDFRCANTCMFTYLAVYPRAGLQSRVPSLHTSFLTVRYQYVEELSAKGALVDVANRRLPALHCQPVDGVLNCKSPLSCKIAPNILAELNK